MKLRVITSYEFRLTCPPQNKGKLWESIEITLSCYKELFVVIQIISIMNFPTFEFLSFRVISHNYAETKLRLGTLVKSPSNKVKSCKFQGIFQPQDRQRFRSDFSIFISLIVIEQLNQYCVNRKVISIKLSSKPQNTKLFNHTLKSPSTVFLLH